MKSRSLVGYLCVAAAFALVVALGMGAINPLGVRGALTSVADMLLALVPSVLLALALFVVGLWLLRGKR